jgi:hypothetical protein
VKLLMQDSMWQGADDCFCSELVQSLLQQNLHAAVTIFLAAIADSPASSCLPVTAAAL